MHIIFLKNGNVVLKYISNTVLTQAAYNLEDWSRLSWMKHYRFQNQNNYALGFAFFVLFINSWGPYMWSCGVPDIIQVCWGCIIFCEPPYINYLCICGGCNWCDFQAIGLSIAPTEDYISRATTSIVNM